MYLILKHITDINRAKVLHNIMYEPTQKDYASLILLNDELRRQDQEYIDKMSASIDRIQFSRDTLTTWKEKFGSLTCVYCQKPNLVIEYDGMKVSNYIKATIDHVVPISDGGGVYDIKNVICACAKCNTKKGSKSLNEYLNNIKLSQEELKNRISIYGI